MTLGFSFSDICEDASARPSAAPHPWVLELSTTLESQGPSRAQQ